MKNKIIAMGKNKLGVLGNIALLLTDNSEYFGITTKLVLGKLQKEQAIALLQKAVSWNTPFILELLNQKLQKDKDVILTAVNKTTHLTHALLIIIQINNILKNDPNLTNHVADALINNSTKQHKLLLMQILQEYLYYTEDEAKDMLKHFNP